MAVRAPYTGKKVWIDQMTFVVIEMDEVNSSSSSSIGREEYANHAFDATNKMRKGKITLQIVYFNIISSEIKLHRKTICSRLDIY